MPNACSAVAADPTASKDHSTPPPVSSKHLLDGVARAGVDGVRRAELAREGELRGPRVDRHDARRAADPRGLHGAEPDAPAADHRDARARRHARGVEDRAEAGRHAAAQQRGHGERHRRVDADDRVLVDEELLGEGSELLEGVDRLAVEPQARRLARPSPRALLVAEVGPSAHAHVAVAAEDREARRHVVARRDVGDLRADRLDDPSRLVAHDAGHREREAPLEGERVAVADARRGGPHEHLARPGRVDRDVGQQQRLRHAELDGGPHSAARRRSAAFSPMSIVAACVLPPTMSGMIDASATRRPSIPRTRSSGSTTASSSMPILHVPTGCQ
jgi:hypothetical protein